MISCPSRTDLSNLLAERLPAEQERGLLAHVETCPICQATLEELTASCALSSLGTVDGDGVSPSREHSL